MHVPISLNRPIRRAQALLIAMLTLVLSGSAAVPFAAAASSGLMTDKAALLDLVARFAPDPALLRSVDGTAGISYGTQDPQRLTFLLLGSDLRPDDPVGSSNERTDMIMVLTINRGTGRMAAASIPRDMAYIPRPGEATFSGRINELFKHYRARGFTREASLMKVKNVVAHLLGAEIDHVAMIRFASFEMLLDELGQIRVDVPTAVKDPKLIDGGNPVGVYFPAAASWVLVGSPTAEYPRCNGWWRHGPNTGQRGYDCHRALMYARTRKGKGNSDFKRQKRGVDILMAAATTALANGSGGRLQSLTNVAEAQHDNNFYSSLPMTYANALEMYDLLALPGTLERRIVFTPPTYASKLSGSAKYRIKVKPVRRWIAANFKP